MGRAEDIFERIQKAGISALDDFILSRQSEELFLEFKRSADMGAGARLHPNDRNNLAKAISGFGNSEGGVVVWGVGCSGRDTGEDVARLKVPIADVPRFVSWLEGAVSGCTVPPHTGVVHCRILEGDGPAGYVASLIPRSDRAPHQAIGKMQYFIRAGSSFEPVPHMVLAGLFGRVPHPDVFPFFMVAPPTLNGSEVAVQVGIGVRNNGPGIAQDMYVNVTFKSLPGPNCRFSFVPLDLDHWAGHSAFDSYFSLISNLGFRLPPEAQAQPLRVFLQLRPPFDGRLSWSGMVGSGSSAPYRFDHMQDAGAVGKAHSEVVAARSEGGKVAHELARQLAGMKENIPGRTRT